MGRASARDVEELYLQRHVAFRNALTGIAGGPEAGADAMQEGFARALVSIDQFRGDGDLEAWVWRICLNEARMGHRRPRADPLEAADAVAGVAVAERDPQVYAAIRLLPPRRRLVVFLRYFADLSYDQIAAATGMRPGTVAATLAKARSELYDTLAVEEVRA